MNIIRLSNLVPGVLIAVLMTGIACASAQTTQPANLPLEYRANQAYNQGRYIAALPLLQEFAGTLIDQPEKLAPVEERIRVAKTAIAAAQRQGTNSFAGTPVAQPADVRVPHPLPKPGETVDLDIKALGNFDYDAEKGGNIPADVTQMSGATIRTRGYMIPLDQAENIGEFALVPSLFACCFGQPPQVQHTIVVHLAPGKAISYFPDELQVEGTLKVQEKKDEGYIVSVFDLDANSVKPRAQVNSRGLQSPEGCIMSQFTADSTGVSSTGLHQPATARLASPPASSSRFVVSKTSLLKRINLRVVLLAAIALMFIGAPFYIWLRDAMSGGIINEGNYSLVNLKSMSSFDMDQINGRPTDIPARFRDLEGKQVALEGQMWDPKEAGNDAISYFQLVYSIAKCCFNGPPLAQHFVDANVVPGRTVYEYGNMVRVWGTLHIRFRKEAGGVIKSIYEVDVDKVEPM